MSEEKNTNLDFREIERMRNAGIAAQQHLKEVENLKPEAIAAELCLIFAHRRIEPSETKWIKKAQVFLEFVKENRLSVENVKDLLKLMNKLSG